MHGVLQLPGHLQDNRKPWKGKSKMHRILFLYLLVFCKFLPWSRDNLEFFILSKSLIEILERLFQISERSVFAYNGRTFLKYLITN